jgi:hypothetical protein
MVVTHPARPADQAPKRSPLRGTRAFIYWQVREQGAIDL